MECNNYSEAWSFLNTHMEDCLSAEYAKKFENSIFSWLISDKDINKGNILSVLQHKNMKIEVELANTEREKELKMLEYLKQKYEPTKEQNDE